MKRLLAFEMRCYRRILAVKWQDRRTNKKIRAVVQRKETVVDIIRMRKLQLYGHICRCRMPDDRLLKTLLFGMVEGHVGAGSNSQLLLDLKDNYLQRKMRVPRRRRRGRTRPACVVVCSWWRLAAAAVSCWLRAAAAGDRVISASLAVTSPARYAPLYCLSALPALIKFTHTETATISSFRPTSRLQILVTTYSQRKATVLFGLAAKTP